jgi:beta-glucanase (GH16 family)
MDAERRFMSLRWTVRLVSPMIAVWTFAMCGGSETRAAPSPTPQPGQWQRSWSDEFDSADGSRPDPSRWVYDPGGNGWGNEELETYTDRAENSRIEGGALVITARAEKFTGADGFPRDYTSARIKTLGRFSQLYGRFEARIKIPRGQGIWPAFWMMGVNIDTRGWPDDGEVDIMENIGREPTTVHGTFHGPGYSGAGGIGGFPES